MPHPFMTTLEIQYIAVRYFAISSISRIVRGPQIYHDHKKKKISKCFFYLIWKKKKKKLTVIRCGIDFSRISKREIASRIMTKQSN